MPTAECLACKSRRTYPLAAWPEMPLSVLGLPRSADEARAMPRYVLDLRRCAFCGHVFHTEFDYDRIPYRTGSNLVYNRAIFWSRYVDALADEWMERWELDGRRVVEIGCGAGGFIARMAEAGARAFAFEPGPDADRARARGIETFREYFQASRIRELRPDAIVCRHVLEHLADPLDFLQDIALTAAEAGLAPVVLAEVPCIDKALAQHRLNDFLYEHVSNFTARSFRTLFERAGFQVLEVRRRFHDEVVTLAARPAPELACATIREESRSFRTDVEPQVRAVRAQLDAWRAEGVRLAIWGATGKGAAFINIFGLTPQDVVAVVDSDPRKVGGFVPGTGHRIVGPEDLRGAEPHRILIATQWRARDIAHELRSVHGLDTPLYVYHRGGLVPLTADLEL